MSSIFCVSMCLEIVSTAMLVSVATNIVHERGVVVH